MDAVGRTLLLLRTPAGRCGRRALRVARLDAGRADGAGGFGGGIVVGETFTDLLSRGAPTATSTYNRQKSGVRVSRWTIGIEYKRDLGRD